jgi:enterochelin esterase family protein
VTETVDAQGDGDMTATDMSLLERAQQQGAPLIDGDRVTFVWEGESAPGLIGDFNQWGSSPTGITYLERVVQNVWAVTLTLPPDAYMEYIFTSDPDDDDARLLDPLNPLQVSNGIGKVNNYFLMPECHDPNLDQFISGLPQGRVTRHAISSESLVLGMRRDVWLYHPPTKEPVPLLVVLDGRDYMRLADITQMVANMIGLNLIRPIALALIDNAKQGRFVEYNASEAAVMMINTFVIPLAYAHLKLIDTDHQPGVWGILGASMGGTQALYTALRQPQIFGKVIGQSGAYNLQINGIDSIVMKLVKDASRKDLKLWLDCGIYDTLLDQNRALHTLLTARGYDVTYREYNAGHNYSAWSMSLPEALKTLFPPE